MTIKVFADTYKGVIIGKDSAGNPQPDFACRSCHGVGTPIDMFTPWAKSGHAEIVEQNVNTLNNHYGPGCVSCHSVGYAPGVSNGGFDDAADFAGLLASGILSPPGAPNNYDLLLAEFPASAKLANIQCDNCHGPTGSEAHFNGVKSDRNSLSSDVCGTCHGEPARHGRYQQWQLSRHGNYETARAEGTLPSCAKCHAAQGFIQWESKGFSNTATITVDWTLDQVHPQTCVTCHDPHAVGTTSGGPTTNATVRISGDTPMMDAGFKATGVGTAAICMTCHNGRRGLRDDQHTTTDISRAPHAGPQADIVMGQNMYFVEAGKPGFHSKIADSCVTCHMEHTKPPADLSYNYGGTNHTFYASKTICSKCHTEIDGEEFQEEIEHSLESLKHEIETALENGMTTALRAGNFVDLGTTRVKSASEIAEVEYIESRGRQGVTVTLSTGAVVADLQLNSVKVVPPAGASVELLATMDPSVAKAGWNYWMVHSDKSKGVHNPVFVEKALSVSLYATKTVNTAYASGVGGGAYLGGGAGNGAGAVSCTTPYVYWKVGQTVSLIGLRQQTGAYRSNIAVSNAGKIEAEVAISLFSANGAALKTYNVTVPAGEVKQEGEPFKNQANQPDLGWGFATVTVLKGTNIHMSASVIDVKTNDPTTVRAQQ